MNLPGHVVLVGLPGAGKTTVGQALAARLGLPFIDFDLEIARRAGQTIPDIFATRGEPWFRALEAELTREVAAAPPAVVAPGGGWAAQPGLVALLRPPAALIHLRVSPATAVARMHHSLSERPLLAGSDPEARAVTLWEMRREAYAQADFEIDTEVIGVQEVVERALQLISRSE
ncbi:MAG TPA: shikimate kinase [Gemmatimonadaceae bacterium]|nr:shikimate kinase [Gemmatimonadaceae bacterium]